MSAAHRMRGAEKQTRGLNAERAGGGGGRGWGGTGGVELNTEAERHAEMERCENRGVKVILRGGSGSNNKYGHDLLYHIHYCYTLIPHF